MWLCVILKIKIHSKGKRAIEIFQIPSLFVLVVRCENFQTNKGRKIWGAYSLDVIRTVPLTELYRRKRYLGLAVPSDLGYCLPCSLGCCYLLILVSSVFTVLLMKTCDWNVLPFPPTYFVTVIYLRSAALKERKSQNISSRFFQEGQFTHSLPVTWK